MLSVFVRNGFMQNVRYAKNKKNNKRLHAKPLLKWYTMQVTFEPKAQMVALVYMPVFVGTVICTTYRIYYQHHDSLRFEPLGCVSQHLSDVLATYHKRCKAKYDGNGYDHSYSGVQSCVGCTIELIVFSIGRHGRRQIFSYHLNIGQPLVARWDTIWTPLPSSGCPTIPRPLWDCRCPLWRFYKVHRVRER